MSSTASSLLSRLFPSLSSAIAPPAVVAASAQRTLATTTNKNHTYVKSSSGPRNYKVGLPKHLAVTVPANTQLVFLSGVYGFDNDTLQFPASVEEQADRALTNLGNYLAEADSSSDGVFRVQLFMEDATEFDKINHAWKKFFKKNPPVRDVVGVGSFPIKGAKLSVSAVAHTVWQPEDLDFAYLQSPW
jgi:2-iminobutanoate/2-iminopropanoate deaminase